LVLWVIQFYQILFNNIDQKYCSRDNRGAQKLTTKENPSYNEDLSKYFKCRSCGKEFDGFGDMQRHIMMEHMQKGDIP
jgi:hypothetical protein